jgi:hypothetical protein
VINLVDAVCVHYIGTRSASEAHHDALEVLHGATGVDARVRDALGRHLGALLDVKSLAQYEGRLLEASDAQAAARHMDRAFQAAAPVAEAAGWPER